MPNDFMRCWRRSRRCTPVIVTDSGFRVPFFRSVQALDWHWLGCIRNRDYLAFADEHPAAWLKAKSLYAKAKVEPQRLGEVSWVRRRPLGAFVVLLRQPKRIGMLTHSRQLEREVRVTPRLGATHTP